MASIPFLRPSIPSFDKYAHYLQSIDASRRYSNFGPLVSEFESRLLQECCGGGHGLTVCNATIGLMLAINAVRRPQGRLCVLPSFTFAATAQAALWCGLELHYVDIDPETWAMDPQQLQLAVEELGEQVAVVLTYATFGTALDLGIYKDLQAAQVPVVIDAAPGFGSQDEQGQPFGGDFAGPIVYSFHATKPFGIGEGGFIFSAEAAVIDAIRRGSNFGFSKPGVTADFGLNAKLSEYAAAIGLAVIDSFAAKKLELEEIYQSYLSAFQAADLAERGCQLQKAEGRCVHQFMPLLLPKGTDKQAVIASIMTQGIELRSYFDPPCHRQVGLAGGGAPLYQTEAVSARVLCLPLWQEMTAEQVERVIGALATALAVKSSSFA